MNPPKGEKYYSVIASRTREILAEVQHKNNATLLMNCLLGLLVVPKEKQIFIEKTLNKKIDDDSLNWLQGKSIKIPCQCGGSFTPTLNQFLRRMRNSIAHFNIESYSDDGENITGFEFDISEKHEKKYPIKFSEDELKVFLTVLMSAAKTNRISSL